MFDLQAEFDKRYIPVTESGCWLWIGRSAYYGYGVMPLGRRGAKELAHRVSWRIHRGVIPKGLNVCHHCDVTACVNPEHLFIGTQSDNLSDMTKKGRRKSPGAPGERNCKAKLSIEDVSWIRSVYFDARGKRVSIPPGHYSGRQLSEYFGVDVHTISRIIRGIRWKVKA